MIEIFDMGKYDFYVWGSIGVFFFALLADYISVKAKSNHIKRLIKTKSRKTRNRSNQR
ncbi:MAG: heme exporter protein CcmD [Xanthomonadales bacterium]|nr:heme exporter protein CcmD [Xanthomonadales bacterium]